jgi:hypothetical protein
VAFASRIPLPKDLQLAMELASAHRSKPEIAEEVGESRLIQRKEKGELEWVGLTRQQQRGGGDF